MLKPKLVILCLIYLYGVSTALDIVYMSEMCGGELFIDEGTGRIELVNRSAEHTQPQLHYPRNWTCEISLKVRNVGRKRIESIVNEVSIFNDGDGGGAEGSPCDVTQDYLHIYRGNYDNRKAELLTPDGVCGVTEDGDWDTERAYLTERYLTLEFRSSGLSPPPSSAQEYFGFAITYQAYTVTEIVSYFDEQRLAGGILSGFLFSLAFVAILVDIVRTKMKKRQKMQRKEQVTADGGNAMSVNANAAATETGATKDVPTITVTQYP